MPIYMFQGAYSGQSWAAQLKDPQNRIEVAGRKLCEAAGGKFLGGWYSFGDYDYVVIVDMPNNESMTAFALAVAAGGSVRSAKTTVLMPGAEIVSALKKAVTVGKGYKPPH